MSARRADLFAAVYAAPDALGPREVLADWLLEQGDPRGEFIARQCASTKLDAGMRALLKRHQRAWLGPLEPVIHKSGVTFSRGFFAEGTVDFRTPDQVDELVDHPAWATVHRLRWAKRVGTVRASVQQAVPTTARSLKVAEGLYDAGLRRLMQAKLPVETLVAVVAEAGTARELGQHPFPALTSLKVLGPAIRLRHFDWLWRAPWARDLRELGVLKMPHAGSTEAEQLADWVAAVEEHTDVEVFQALLHCNAWWAGIARHSFTFRRGTDGRLSHLTVVAHSPCHDHSEVRAELRGLNLTELVAKKNKFWTPPDDLAPTPAPTAPRLDLVPPLTDVAWGDELAIAHGGGVTLWPSGKTLPAPGPVEAVAVSAGRVAVIGDFGTHVVGGFTRGQASALPTWTPAGLAVAEGDDVIVLAEDGAPVQRFALGGRARGLRLGPGGQLVAWTWGRGAVFVLDPASGASARHKTGKALCVDWLDADTLGVATGKRIKRWRVSAKKQVGSWAYGGWVRAESNQFRVSPDGEHLALGALLVFDTTGFRWQASLGTVASAPPMAWSPDSGQLALLSDGRVTVHALDDGLAMLASMG